MDIAARNSSVFCFATKHIDTTLCCRRIQALHVWYRFLEDILYAILDKFTITVNLVPKLNNPSICSSYRSVKFIMVVSILFVAKMSLWQNQMGIIDLLIRKTGITIAYNTCLHSKYQILHFSLSIDIITFVGIQMIIIGYQNLLR